MPIRSNGERHEGDTTHGGDNSRHSADRCPAPTGSAAVGIHGRPEAAMARAIRSGAAGIQSGISAISACLSRPGISVWRSEARDDRRLEALGEKLDGGNIALRRIRADDRPIAGTRLIREYQGVEHVVTVLQDGFEYEGGPYRSLSAIARAITGTRWNGWTFFGLRGDA